MIGTSTSRRRKASPLSLRCVEMLPKCLNVQSLVAGVWKGPSLRGPPAGVLGSVRYKVRPFVLMPLGSFPGGCSQVPTPLSIPVPPLKVSCYLLEFWNIW